MIKIDTYFVGGGLFDLGLVRSGLTINKSYEIDKICHKYLEGIFWNFHYYNYGCISWEWNFPYAQPPSFRDVYLYLHNFVSNINEMNIPRARPFKPFEQLLMVLPQQSKELLPKSYQTLMLFQL